MLYILFILYNYPRISSWLEAALTLRVAARLPWQRWVWTMGDGTLYPAPPFHFPWAELLLLWPSIIKCTCSVISPQRFSLKLLNDHRRIREVWRSEPNPEVRQLQEFLDCRRCNEIPTRRTCCPGSAKCQQVLLTITSNISSNSISSNKFFHSNIFFFFNSFY